MIETRASRLRLALLTQVFGMHPGEIASKNKKNSNFLKYAPVKSLERDETNQIKYQHDEPGIGQKYY